MGYIAHDTNKYAAATLMITSCIMPQLGIIGPHSIYGCTQAGSYKASANERRRYIYSETCL